MSFNINRVKSSGQTEEEKPSIEQGEQKIKELEERIKEIKDELTELKIIQKFIDDSPPHLRLRNWDNLIKESASRSKGIFREQVKLHAEFLPPESEMTYWKFERAIKIQHALITCLKDIPRLNHSPDLDLEKLLDTHNEYELLLGFIFCDDLPVLSPLDEPAWRDADYKKHLTDINDRCFLTWLYNALRTKVDEPLILGFMFLDQFAPNERNRHFSPMESQYIWENHATLAAKTKLKRVLTFLRKY